MRIVRGGRLLSSSDRGKTRKVWKFLWLPRTFTMEDGSRETRWLCHAQIQEEVQLRDRYGDGCALDEWFWQETGFVPEPISQPPSTER